MDGVEIARKVNFAFFQISGLIDKMKPSSDQERPLTLFSFRVRRRFALALALVAALSAGASLERWVLMTGIPADSAGDFRLMAQAWEIIDRYYVDRPAVRHAAASSPQMSNQRPTHRSRSETRRCPSSTHA